MRCMYGLIYKLSHENNVILTGAEEVVHMRGAGLTQTYLWFGKVRPKKKKKGHDQLTTAFHLTSYAFIADKLHKSFYIARSLHTHCFIRVTALLEYLDLYHDFQPHSKKIISV